MAERSNNRRHVPTPTTNNLIPRLSDTLFRMAGADGSSSWNWVRWVPNMLSVGRLGIAAAFPFSEAAWRAPLALAAGLSDWLDGLITRRLSGMILDSVADKAFVLSALLTLAFEGAIAWWQVAAVLIRDVSVAVVAATAAGLREWTGFGRMTPRVPGKITTLLLFAWLVAMLIDWAAPLRWPLFWATALSGALAAIDYLFLFIQGLRQRRERLSTETRRTPRDA
jgi:cardiolipin synthase